jgi:hypothetical protein
MGLPPPANRCRAEVAARLSRARIPGGILLFPNSLGRPPWASVLLWCEPDLRTKPYIDLTLPSEFFVALAARFRTDKLRPAFPYLGHRPLRPSGAGG